MKKYLFIFFILFNMSVNGQNDFLSLSLGVGLNNMTQDKLHRKAQYDGEKFNTVELRYSHLFGSNRRWRKSKRWGFEIGANYSLHEYFAINADTTYLEKSHILHIPAYGKVQFNDYLYLSAGIIYTLELNYSSDFLRSKQNGFGAGAEFGANYELNRNWDLIFAIFARQHNIFPLAADYTYEAMLEYGLKLGIQLKI